MPVLGGIDYPDTFGGVVFSAGADQSYKKATEFADETIVGGAVSGTSFVFRDWYVLPPDVLDLTILVPDRATFESLAELRGYPVDNGGTPYDLSIPAQGIEWTATLDELTANGAYLDMPLRCRAVFTKVTDVGSDYEAPVTATAGYVAGVDGLDVDLDLNQGTTSSDGFIDSYDVEWGDAGTSHVTGGPWSIADAEIPVASHTYAAPSPTGADYVVTVSVVRGSVTSSDFSSVVTV